MSGTSVLFDDLGPRGRRRVRVASIASGFLILALVLVAYRRLESSGQLEQRLWEPFSTWPAWRFLLKGLTNTLKAAAVAMLLALVLGTLMALGRLARNRPARWMAGAYVEFFRAVPLLLLILFPFFVLPKYGVDLSPFASLVIGLTLYNSAMLAEIFRAGLLSLDTGQTEAASSLGLSYWQSMLHVVVPQAGRRMVPGIVSQLVALLKDTALGYVVTYEELLRDARIAGEFFHNPLQMYLAAALMYFSVNYALSRIARRLEVRQRRRFNAAPTTVVMGSEDLAAAAAPDH